MSNPHATVLGDQFAAQLEHPDANAVWQRAVEVFGDKAKAQGWMNSPRSIFDAHSPQELVATGDPIELRRVLEILLRIDYGVLS